MDLTADNSWDRPRMQVNPANVLRVRAALLAESDRLDAALERGDHGDWVGLCGGDPLSSDARAAFDNRIAEVVNRCRSYSDGLRGAGAALARVARDYGHTEAEIAASYRRIQRGATG